LSQTEALEHGVEPAESPLTPESWGKTGMWIFLSGDAMSFGTLLAGYAILRSTSDNWPIPADVLGISLTAFMTFLLICSSLTMVKALDAIKNQDRTGFQRFLGLTILGGIIFLGLQAYEWDKLINHDKIGLSENPFGSPLFGTTFYMITGFHGMHVTGGVIYLACVFAAVHRRNYAPDCYNLVENVGLYWHFVDLVWILVFTFVYLL
jgi:heme/copper-type cytochrome/quinol oxidase subunit 3